MNANLNFLTAPAPNTLHIGEHSPAAGSKPAAGRSMLGKEFANLMRGLLPEGERQGLAASGTAANQSLQTLTLGKQFAVITADAPQPDANSLAAFAKAQGLNDQAVQALFGDLPPLTPPVGLKLGTSSTETTADPLTWLKEHPGDLMGTAAITPPSWFGNPAANGATPLTIGQAPGVTDTPSATSSDALAHLLAASGAAATIAQISKTEGKAPPTPPAGLALPPEPGPLDVMRMRLMPAWENMTKTLAQATGDTVFPWASVAAGLMGGKTSDVKTLDIDLGDLGDVDGLGAIGSATDTGNGLGTVSATFNNDNSAQINRASDKAPALTLSGQDPSPAVDRAAQIGQLADKLGQALSERLQDQMAQGEWKLELRLKPAHLGKISVELDMRAGGLDALFKTDNPLTRELIAQSAPKLRDNLAQAGMAVANVWVNSDGQGQTGGNPTPRQSSSGAGFSQQTVSNPAEMKVQAPRAKSNDGWDELV